MARVTPIVQPNVFATPSAFTMTIPVAVASGSGPPSNVASTVPIEVLTLEEMKAVFGEVSSTF